MRELGILTITFLLLFIGTNIQTAIGIDPKLFYSVIIAISMLFCMHRRKVIFNNKIMFFLIMLVCTYSIFKLYSDRGEGTRQLVLQVLGTPLIFSAYPLITEHKGSKTIKLWRKITKLLFLSFIFEISLAIIERIMNYNFFKWEINNTIINFSENGIQEFRSAALYGHPLYNALIVSTIMAFILISNLKIKYKYLLWGMGYIAILCFNTRSSIIGNGLLLLCYLLYTIFKSRNRNKRYFKQSSIATIIIISIGLFLYFRLGFGNRLMEYGIIDDSSQTRIDVWRIFNYTNLNDILWGVPHEKMQFFLYRSGLQVTENFWIDQLFRLGIIFYSLYIFLYILFIKKLYKGYSHFSALFTAGAFVLIASANNSLASNFLALLIYLILIVIFNPMHTNMIFRKRHLDIKQNKNNHTRLRLSIDRTCKN